MKYGLKEHEVSALVSRLAKKLRECFKTPESTRDVVGSVVVDYLEENGLRHGKEGRNPITDCFDPTSLEEIRAAFEEQHKGRRLDKHYVRGTYSNPAIAALWNQHLYTIQWMLSGTKGPDISVLPYYFCTGHEKMLDKCNVCQHHDRLVNMLETTITHRIKLQRKGIQIKNEDCCASNGKLYQERVV